MESEENLKKKKTKKKSKTTPPFEIENVGGSVSIQKIISDGRTKCFLVSLLFGALFNVIWCVSIRLSTCDSYTFHTRNAFSFKCQIPFIFFSLEITCVSKQSQSTNRQENKREINPDDVATIFDVQDLIRIHNKNWKTRDPLILCVCSIREREMKKDMCDVTEKLPVERTLGRVEKERKKMMTIFFYSFSKCFRYELTTPARWFDQ